MAKYSVHGTFRVDFELEVEADTEEGAIKEVEEGMYNPVLDFNWKSEDIEVDWAEEVSDV